MSTEQTIELLRTKRVRYHEQSKRASGDERKYLQGLVDGLWIAIELLTTKEADGEESRSQ